MRRRFLGILLGILIPTFWLHAQHRPLVDYDALLLDIESSLIKGEKRALRDLGSLLNVPDYRDKVHQLLIENTLLVNDELVIDENLNKEKFLAFYYENENQITFSPLTKAFHISDPKKFNIKFELRPFENEDKPDIAIQIRKLSEELEMALDKNNYTAAIHKIVNIGNLETKEAYDFLIELSTQKSITKAKQGGKSGLIQAILSQLSKDNRLSTLKSMLNLLDEDVVNPRKAKKFLTRMTNVDYPSISSIPQVISFYSNLVDSLKTIEDIRQFGYTRYFNFSPDFFDHPVDYYGQILADAGDMTWVEENAIKDLANIGHPRALHHLAANVYKKRTRKNQEHSEINENIFREIERLTQTKLGLENEEGEISFERYPEDYKFQRNYYLYWAKHYSDYLWEENQGVFINKNDAAKKEHGYEKLFRRLNSRNDSIAIAAFNTLCEGDPLQVSELAEKYRQLMRTYNSNLPSFKYHFLESMTRLTQYCKHNNIEYNLSPTLSEKVTELKQASTPEDQLKLENEIIESLNLKTVTGLEYWAILNEADKKTNFSIGRIIDLFYSNNWNQIVNNEKQLRHYLKKSYLFENIGMTGVCNSYLRKFDLENSSENAKLVALSKVESDPEISNQINQLIGVPSEDKDFNLKDFIENPAFYSGKDIKLLPDPNSTEINELTKLIGTLSNKESLKKILFFLRFHGDVKMVPPLMKFIEDERAIGMKNGNPVTLGESLAAVFENIYNYTFEAPEGKSYNTDVWKKLWTADSLSYKSWGIGFLEKDLTKLENKDTLTIAEINNITTSRYYDPMLKSRCLRQMRKVYPKKDVRKLEIEPALSVLDDLKYFEGFRFSYKVLDDIPKLFLVNDPGKMVDYLMKQAQDFDVENQGIFYNKMFQLDWFQMFVANGNSNTAIASSISRILQEYLSQSEYITEFQEQQTNIHIAQLNNIGKSLYDRLESSVLNDLDESSKYAIQQAIIANITYDEIGTVINYIDQLSKKPGENPIDFLNKDFGIPVFDILDSKKFLNNLKNLDQEDFYLKYLSKIGIDLKKGKELDLDKIYEILQFDIVSPFIGDGGKKRDNYVYGVIKVLELHYKTKLGFHEKLNENQRFYTYTATKRAEAWSAYLREKGLIKINPNRPSSFNHSIDLAEN